MMSLKKRWSKYEVYCVAFVRLTSVVCRYALGYIKKAPNNESPWNYLRG